MSQQLAPAGNHQCNWYGTYLPLLLFITNSLLPEVNQPTAQSWQVRKQKRNSLSFKFVISSFEWLHLFYLVNLVNGCAPTTDPFP